MLASSLANTFATNAVNNGLLPARVAEADAEQLLQLLKDGLGVLTVNLQECRVQTGRTVFSFMIDPVFRSKLLDGWDDLDLIASYGKEIAAFAARAAGLRLWMPRRRE